MKRTTIASSVAFLVVAGSTWAQGSPAVIERIIDEGKNNTQIWKYLEHISYEIGTRLTGSSGLQEANEWTRDEFERLGLSNAHLRQWGDVPVGFDRGPSSAKMTAPDERVFEFTTRSWGAGTDGPVSGIVIKEPKTLEELEAVADKLPGAWILSQPRQRRRRGVTEAPEGVAEINARMKEAGILGRIVAGRGEIIITGAERGWRDMDYNNLPTDVSISVRRSDYDAINSRLADGNEVTVEANLDHTFNEGPIPLYNTIAEIKGTEFPDEIIIVSGHLDSWDGPGSMGTQDNGTGTSVTLETARILMAAGIQPRRTIRFCLWTGEEQGLLGSRAYVKSLSEEEQAKISAVFVDDGGTNYEGGLVGLHSMIPMLTEATAPISSAFPDMPVEVVGRDRMPRGGGSDHASFNAVGVPGFFWMEKGSGGREGKNYRYIHHTQHDTPRYAVEEYLVQSATCSAVTAYNLAMADTLLPRTVPVEPEEEAAEEAAAPVAMNDDAAALIGTWNATRVNEESGRSSEFQLVFKAGDDGKVHGTVISPRGEAEVSGITLATDTGEVQFTYDGGYGTIEYKATLEGDTMKGTMGMDDAFNMAFTATRANAGGAADDDAPFNIVEGPVSGTWDAVFAGDEGEEGMDGFTLILEMSDDGRIRGRTKSDMGEGTITSGAWDAENKSATFNLDIEDAVIGFTVTVDGDSMTGTLGIPDSFTMDFKATRKK